MVKYFLAAAALVLAGVPAAFGMMDNASFARDVPVRVPEQARISAPTPSSVPTTDDHGQHAGPGDGASRHAEPRDENTQGPEPGDGNTQSPEPGDDRGHDGPAVTDDNGSSHSGHGPGTGSSDNSGQGSGSGSGKDGGSGSSDG